MSAVSSQLPPGREMTFYAIIPPFSHLRGGLEVSGPSCEWLGAIGETTEACTTLAIGHLTLVGYWAHSPLYVFLCTL